MLVDKRLPPPVDDGTTSEDTDHFPYTVVMPVAQRPDWTKQFEQLTTLLRRLIGLGGVDGAGEGPLCSLGGELGVNPGRMFLLGQSMGGNGVLELAMQNPGIWRAVVPVCGYVDIGNASLGAEKKVRGSFSQNAHAFLNAKFFSVAIAPCPLENDRVVSIASESSQFSHNQRPRRFRTIFPPQTRLTETLSNTPIWVFHAADDNVVNVAHSDSIVEALKGEDNNMVKYTRYETAPGLPGFGDKGRGHASWELAFLERGLWDWMGGLAER